VLKNQVLCDLLDQLEWKLNERNQISNKQPVPVCINLGSNINPRENIQSALEALANRLPVIQISSLWKSPPYRTDGSNFLNAAVLIETDLDAVTLKESILTEIENDLCRVRTEDKFTPRTIDLDIITYGDQIIDENVWELSFVAVPVSEIIPNLVHPETQETVGQIADRLSKEFEITKVDKLDD
jgi:2-amino-4-hydroxy-6-hydroxymethyldihydropteridine diphosphokinase